LILPCAKRKKDLACASALELYDGPFYHIIRKNRKSNLDILIISAKYGLIRSDDNISYYDQMMTPERAKFLSKKIDSELRLILKNNYYSEIYVNLGKTYAITLFETKKFLEEYNVIWANGKIGERLHLLKSWLNNIPDGDGELVGHGTS
jgi:lipocalin